MNDAQMEERVPLERCNPSDLDETVVPAPQLCVHSTEKGPAGPKLMIGKHYTSLEADEWAFQVSYPLQKM